jgi:hypothetical protein
MKKVLFAFFVVAIAWTFVGIKVNADVPKRTITYEYGEVEVEELTFGDHDLEELEKLEKNSYFEEIVVEKVNETSIVSNDEREFFFSGIEIDDQCVLRNIIVPGEHLFVGLDGGNIDRDGRSYRIFWFDEPENTLRQRCFNESLNMLLIKEGFASLDSFHYYRYDEWARL